ncbi:MAG: hypothetical protein AABX10_04080 [Nanoarchaeota archaeon]
MRKGMETNEFLGFIIAVIGIVLLGFFGVKLYNFFVDADMKNAQAFIDDLSGKIETLGVEEKNTFLLRGVKGWVLVGWNKEVPIAKDNELIGKDRKPQKCFDKACLCLCEDKISNCQDVGFCREIDGNISVLSKIQYVGGNEDGSFEAILYSSCIVQIPQLMDLSVNKSAKNISIYYDYGKQVPEWVNDIPNRVLDSLSNSQSNVGKLEGCFVSQEIISRA